MEKKLVNGHIIRPRADYIQVAPMNITQKKIIKKQLNDIRERKMNAEKGQKSKQVTNSTITEKSRKQYIKTFKRQKTMALRKFVKTYQEQLDYACYEKIFYALKNVDKAFELMCNMRFIEITEHKVKPNPNKPNQAKTRRRYYVRYDKHEEFIKYLLDNVVAPFRPYNRKPKEGEE